MTPQILEAVHDAIVAVSARNPALGACEARARDGGVGGANGVLISALARAKRARP